MQINLNNASTKQYKNAGRLMVKAVELGIEIDQHCEIGYNDCYGNTFLWSEYYNFTLFISDFDPVIKALYSCPYDGEESERNYSNDEKAMMKWAERLQRKSEKKDQD